MGKTITYSGTLIHCSNGEENDLLGLDEGQWENRILAEAIQEDMKECGHFLTVRYFLFNQPMPAQVIELALAQMVDGIASVDYGMCYSEYTGYLWTDEEIVVGGHDLLAELKSHLGKWAYLEITYSKTPRGDDA